MTITINIVNSNPAHGEVYSIQHYVLKFVSDLRQAGGFLWVIQFTRQKNDCQDIAEILLKVGLNTKTNPSVSHKYNCDFDSC